MEAAGMKVDVWSDVICPWCGLANYRLHEALRRFEHAGDVELVHHSYEMAPDLPGGKGISQRELLAQVGKTGQAAENYIRPIEQLAKRDGLVPYVVMDRMMGNTALAHELLAYATGQGRGPEAWEYAYRVHFGESRPLFDVESLLALAAETGLDADGARETLASRRFRGRVAQDKADAHRLGAQGVPFTVVDGRYGMSGAQEQHQAHRDHRLVEPARVRRGCQGDRPAHAAHGRHLNRRVPALHRDQRAPGRIRGPGRARRERVGVPDVRRGSTAPHVAGRRHPLLRQHPDWRARL
jgi:predicted DsbA family dithiol-disulfide isomerase